MRLHRNIIEYAASKEIDAESPEEAKLALIDLAIDNVPLYARGEINMRNQPRYKTELMTEKEWLSWRKKFLKEEPHSRKHYQRRVRVLLRFDAKADLQARMLNLLSLEDCAKLAARASRALEQKREEEIASAYDDDTRPTISVQGVLRGDISAEYSRMHASFKISREALMELPCAPIVHGYVILHAHHVTNDVWFMRWAGFRGRVKKFSIASGGYYDGELVIGYETHRAVFANYDTIQKLARTRAVTRAMKG